jgi:hypothetical protein
MSRRDLTAETRADTTNIELEARARGLDAYKVRASNAVGDRLVADLVSDFRRPVSQSGSMIPDRARAPEPQKKGDGWAEPAPLKPPPGIEIIDAMCDAQDRVDRAAAIRQQSEAAWIEAHFEKGPRIETEYNPFDSARIKEK